MAGKDYCKNLADEVAIHLSGTLTLVIVNRVARAQGVYRQLLNQGRLKQLPKEQITLIHSRFRGAKRKKLNQRLREHSLTGIIVATQAIEAGDF